MIRRLGEEGRKNRMGMININFVMDMTKSYLDGKIHCINYYLDFPYEVEMRYRRMVRENREYAELIFDCLVEEGAYKYNDLSDAQFEKLIRKQYKYVKEVITSGC